MAERGGVPAEVAINTKLVPNYASFYGEPLMPPSDEGKKLTPQEFQEQFPVRYDVWNTLSQSMLGHSESGVSLNNPDHIKTLKTRLHVINQLDRYITAHHLGENGRTLRGRQITVFEDIRDHLEQGETSGYVKLPTGSGKTVIFTEVAEATDLKTLIVVPRQLLVDQTEKRFKRFAPTMEVGKVYAGKKERGKQVEITTYESMLSSIEKGLMDPKEYDLVVLDEMHKGLSQNRQIAITQFTNAIKLGFTATPNYSETRKVGDLLGKEIHSMTVREGVEEGILSPLSVYLVRTNTDISNVKVTAGGDYDPEDLEKAINNKERNIAAVQTYQELMKNPDNQGTLSIAYCAGVQHAKDLASEFQKVGVPAGVIYGGQNKAERQKILMDYEAGTIPVLCNARLLIEGFDEPKTGIILNVAPTASLVDAEQRGGRGLRLDENNPNKHAIIVDIVDQTSNRKFKPVTFAQIVDGAYVLSRSRGSSSDKRYPPGDEIIIDVEGVEVISDPEEVMRIVSELKNGVSKEAPDLQEGEISTSSTFLRSLFSGNNTRMLEAAQKVVSDMMNDHPEYIVRRKNSQLVIQAITLEGREEFLRRMKENGFPIKVDRARDEEIVLGSKPIERKFFIGLKKARAMLTGEIKQFIDEHPEYVATRQVGTATLQVITPEGQAEFIKLMQDKGAPLRENMPEKLKEGEIGISPDSLKVIFQGTHEKLNPTAKQVIDQMSQQNPAWIVQRQSGTVIIMAVSTEGREEFIKRMKEMGTVVR